MKKSLIYFCFLYFQCLSLRKFSRLSNTFKTVAVVTTIIIIVIIIIFESPGVRSFVFKREYYVADAYLSQNLLLRYEVANIESQWVHICTDTSGSSGYTAVFFIPDHMTTSVVVVCRAINLNNFGSTV